MRILAYCQGKPANQIDCWGPRLWASSDYCERREGKQELRNTAVSWILVLSSQWSKPTSTAYKTRSNLLTIREIHNGENGKQLLAWTGVFHFFPVVSWYFSGSELC